MKISILAAGSGGMYCGSCMRDNALATALQRQGHRVTLVPLYTPLRVEEDGSAGPADEAADEIMPAAEADSSTFGPAAPAGAAGALASPNVGKVYYGGVNVYLQHALGVFRHTPRLFDWVLDRGWLLNAAGRMGAQTPPEKLVGLTADILKGEHGPTMKELRRLVEFLKTDIKPEVVSLPNLMFIGMAETFRRELAAPVVCELTGEDIFLNAMRPEDRERVREAIRSKVRDVSKFVATSGYYADQMAAYLGVPREQIDVIYPGIPKGYLRDGHGMAHAIGAVDRPPTVGYLARICPEKGLGRLVDAMELLHDLPGMSDVHLEVGGYVGKRDLKWYKGLQERVARSALAGKVTWRGEVTKQQKLQLLDSIDVFSAPGPYAEAKGIFVLEALARGVPVVQPAHGSYPELIARTGGGVLVPPGDARALAEALAELLRDAARRRELGEAGRKAVAEAFTDDHMARNMVKVYEDLLARG